MEELSVSAFWAALIATGIGVFFYGAYAFGSRVALRQMAANGGAGVTVATFERLPDWFGRFGTLSTWVATALLTLSLFARWQATGYAPWSNLWEYTAAFAGGIMLFYLVFERWHGQRTLGAFIQPLALALMVTSAAFFSSEVQPLVPALQSRGILTAHVGIMILAYGALSVSFGAGVMYLLQGGQRNRFSRLPKASLLDEIAYRSVMVGFPLLAVGIVLGAYWANSAWGRYWGWDPKETSILISWLIYAAYMHTRGLRSWAGMRSAIVLLIGFASIMFSYFAVNLFVSGLHSYAGV